MYFTCHTKYEKESDIHITKSKLVLFKPALMCVHSQRFASGVTAHKWSEPACLRLSVSEIICNLEKVLSYFKLKKLYIKNSILSSRI